VLEALTTILLAVHLLAMNVASAGPLVCVWVGWGRQKFGDLGTQVGYKLAWYCILALSVGMITGGLMLVTRPSDNLWSALRRFPASAYWFAGAELMFSLVCLISLAAAWNALSRWWLALLAFASATNLLYHFPPLMAVIGQLTANARWTAEPIIDRPIVLKLMADGEVLALSIHFGMSSLAVAALVVLDLLSHEAVGEDIQEMRSMARGAAVIALSASLLQVPIGIWLLTSLPATSRTALMGNNIWASLAFVAALVTTIKLLQQLVIIVLGETDKKNLRKVLPLVSGVVLLMTMSLRLSRPIAPLSEEATNTAPGATAQG
jgi:hypothetical protein